MLSLRFWILRGLFAALAWSVQGFFWSTSTGFFWSTSTVLFLAVFCGYFSYRFSLSLGPLLEGHFSCVFLPLGLKGFSN